MRLLAVIVGLMLGLSLSAFSPLDASELTRYFSPLPFSIPKGGGSLELSADTAVPASLTVQARVSLRGVKPSIGESKQWWGLTLGRGADALGVRLHCYLPGYDDVRIKTVVEVWRDGERIERRLSDAFSNDPAAYNSLVLEVNPDGLLKVSGGCEELSEILTLSLPAGPTAHARLETNAAAEVAMFVMRSLGDASRLLSTPWTAETLDAYLTSSSDPLEGRWTYLDRSTAPDYARLGGKYVIAIVRSDARPYSPRPAGQARSYDILYISGAEILADRWAPFMLKGILTPTPTLDGSYSLTWHTATLDTLDDECFATLTPEPRLLTLSFPLLDSSLRFIPCK